MPHNACVSALVDIIKAINYTETYIDNGKLNVINIASKRQQINADTQTRLQRIFARYFELGFLQTCYRHRRIEYQWYVLTCYANQATIHTEIHSLSLSQIHKWNSIMLNKSILKSNESNMRTVRCHRRFNSIVNSVGLIVCTRNHSRALRAISYAK